MGFWKKPSEPALLTDKSAAPKIALAEMQEPVLSPQAGMGLESRAANPEEAVASRFGKIRSALGSGTVIQGKLSFDTPVRIDGKLSGEVFSSKALIIGKAGLIDAALEVASLIVMGAVRGKVKATERIEVWAGGSIEADLVTPVLVIDDGATFSGTCTMPGRSAGGAPKAASGTVTR